MSTVVLMLLDYIEKSIGELGKGIRKGNLTRIKAEHEKLAAFSDCVESFFPEEFVERVFLDYDRHLDFIGYWIKKRDLEWIESNFDDLAENDFPNLKPQVYDFLEKSKLPERKVASSKNIFIVHGRDHKPVKELKSMLRGLGLSPIVLHEQASIGLTLAEKLEKYSKDIGYAVVILTPDDVGCQQTEIEDFRRELEAPIWNRTILATLGWTRQLYKKLDSRARQNVIFEMGYFWGLLERKRVCCLLKGDVERPSDIEGIVYIPFRDSIIEIKDKIIEELKAAGYEIKILKEDG